MVGNILSDEMAKVHKSEIKKQRKQIYSKFDENLW